MYKTLFYTISNELSCDEGFYMSETLMLIIILAQGFCIKNFWIYNKTPSV